MSRAHSISARDWTLRQKYGQLQETHGKRGLVRGTQVNELHPFVFSSLCSRSTSRDDVCNYLRLGHTCFLCRGEQNTVLQSILAWAAITKNHRQGGLNNRNLSSHSSGGWKSEIKVSEGWGSGMDPLPGLQIATFLLCPHLKT